MTGRETPTASARGRPALPSRRAESGRNMVELLINIDVSNLEAGLRFYTDGLGLRLRRQLSPDIAELEGASSLVYLVRHPPGSRPFPRAEAPRDYRRHWTPVHLDIVVAELEPAITRAESAGATREGDLRQYDWGQYLVMVDPFGNGFCLLQFHGAGYSEIPGADGGRGDSSVGQRHAGTERHRLGWRAIVAPIFFGLVGCDATFVESPRSVCYEAGAQCALQGGVLGVCERAPCDADTTPPCYVCTPQH